VSNEKREDRRAKGEVDQIPGKSVSGLLYRGTRALCIFDRLNDLAEGRLLAQTFGANLKCAGLIDGSRVNIIASRLFAGHRLAGNRSLFYIGMSA
jgi:hypothetical protein